MKIYKINSFTMCVVSFFLLLIFSSSVFCEGFKYPEEQIDIKTACSAIDEFYKNFRLKSQKKIMRNYKEQFKQEKASAKAAFKKLKKTNIPDSDEYLQKRVKLSIRKYRLMLARWHLKSYYNLLTA